MLTEDSNSAVVSRSSSPVLLRMLSIVGALVALVFAVSIALVEIFFLADLLSGAKYAPSIFKIAPILLFAVLLFFLAYGLYRLKKWVIYLYASIFLLVVVPCTLLLSYSFLFGGAYLGAIFFVSFLLVPPLSIGVYFWTQRRWFT